MASKRGKRPLEWSGQRVSVVNSTVLQSAEVNLALRDDEIAEIWAIQATLSVDAIVDNAVAMLLSMDPDSTVDPMAAQQTAATDLEVFFHRWFECELITAVGMYVPTQHYYERHDPPILVGTNISLNAAAEIAAATTTIEAMVKVFFTRRKANAAELNQILLKRR